MSYIDTEEFKNKAATARAKMKESQEAFQRKLFDIETGGTEKVQTVEEFIKEMEE